VENILPLPVITQLVEGYYTFLYPTWPFPIRSAFTENLRQRVDLQDASFLALTASLIGTFMACVPHRAMQMLAAANIANDEGTYTKTLHTCEAVSKQARAKAQVHNMVGDIYTAMTDFFLSLMMGSSFDHKRRFLLLDQSLTTVMYLNLDHEEDNDIDPSKHETRSRLFWSIFALAK